MRIIKKILSSHSGSTLINTMIGAAVLSGVAVLISQGITQQRTQAVRINAGGTCSAAVKSAMDNLKAIDNNRQGSVSWSPALVTDPATMLELARQYNPAAVDPARYNYKTIFTDAATNPIINAAVGGVISPTFFPNAMSELPVVGAFNDVGCVTSDCSAENNQYNVDARIQAGSSILTYQHLNSATSRLAYLYNLDPDVCTEDTGIRIDNLGNWGNLLRVNDITQSSGLSGFQSMNAKIERVNLLDGTRDCVGAGIANPFLPIPEGSGTGGGGADAYGLEVTLILNFNQDNIDKACVVKNNFSQTKLASSPVVAPPVITPVNPATQINPPDPQFCGTAPSAPMAGDEATPDINIRITESGEGVVSFCRVEFMDTNRGFVTQNPFLNNTPNTAPAGYEYADSGWFLCKVPIANFQAGVDVSAVDPGDLVGTVLNNAANRATIGIFNFSNATSNTIDLRLTNLPEGKFTISSFAVDASQTASPIVSGNFFVDLYRPVAATGIQPVAGGVIGQFDDPNVRLHEFRSWFPNVDNIGALEASVRANFRSNNKIYQCKPGASEFEMNGFDEMYEVTPRGVRWYFGPSSVSNANLDTYLQYTDAEVANFNATPPASHPTKFHPKEAIVDPLGAGTVTGPILDNYLESGEWVAVALPKDDCGFGFSQDTSRRTWVVDMEDRPTIGPATPDGTLDVEVAGGSTNMTFDRPTFTYPFAGSKEKHRVGNWAGTKQLPHLYICETAGVSAGAPNEAPGNIDKSFYTYLELFDLYQTFGIPDVPYDPTNGRYDLTYNTAVPDTAVGYCTQPNFENACVEDPNSKIGVAAVDACGRVVGDDALYELRGYSDGYVDGDFDGDICKNIDCAPGYICDKVGPDAGRCKTPEEVNWSNLAARAAGTPYPFQNCNGLNCGPSVNCGVDSDCVNDTGTGATCVNSQLACTNGGVAYSSAIADIIGTNPTPPFSPAPANSQGNQTTGIIASGTPHCLPDADWEDKRQELNGSSLLSCSFYSNSGTDACSFTENRINNWVLHNSNGLRACPTTVNSYYEWRDNDTTSCTVFDSTVASTADCSVAAPLNNQCFSPATQVNCDTGRSKVASYAWNMVPASTQACVGTNTPASCSGTMDITSFGEATVGDALAACGGNICGPGFCTGPQPAEFCCDSMTTTTYNFCTCSGTYTPASTGNSCDPYDDFSNLPPCNSGNINTVQRVKIGTNSYEYRCEIDSYTCSVPRRQCTFRNGAPPWVSQNTNHSLSFNGQCNVNPGTCDTSTLTPNRSSAGPIDNLTCPNLNPLDPVCGATVPVCADQSANYCSGVPFVINSCGSGVLNCTGVTTPNCDHLTPSTPGDYTLLTGQSVGQCLANGYTDCQSANTSCIGQTYTCGAITACGTNEIQYTNLAQCTSSHGAANCSTIPSGPNAGQACGKGCHPSVAHQGTTEALCNAGEDRNCSAIHGTITGVNNWCATKCSSVGSVTTYDSVVDCEIALGVGNCAAETVMDATVTPRVPTEKGCGAPNDCPATHPTKDNNLVNCINNSGSLADCLRQVRSGTCQAYPVCNSGQTPIFRNDMISCNGSNATLGTSVSTECCKQSPSDTAPTSCSYVQDYRYLDDTTGSETVHKVFCPQSGSVTPASCAWSVNEQVHCNNLVSCAQVGITTPPAQDDTPVVDGASCTSGDSPLVWNARMGGYVSSTYTATCQCSGAPSGGTSTCGSFTTGVKVAGGGGSILSFNMMLGLTQATCEAQCKSDCEADNSSTCMANFNGDNATDPFDAPSCVCTGYNTSMPTEAGDNGPYYPNGYDSVASCVPTVTPPPPPPMSSTYSWKIAGTDSMTGWGSTDITTACNGGTEFDGAACNVASLNRTCRVSPAGEILICSEDDWEWALDPTVYQAPGCPGASTVTEWVAATPFVPATPSVGQVCFNGKVDEIGVRPGPPCDYNVFNCEYTGSAAPPITPAPSPTTCQQYWCQAAPPSVPATGCTFSGPSFMEAKSFPFKIGSSGSVSYAGGQITINAGESAPGYPGFCNNTAAVPATADPNSLTWYSTHSGLCASSSTIPGPRGLFATCPKVLTDYEYRVRVNEQIPNFNFGSTSGADQFFLKEPALVYQPTNYDSGWIQMPAMNDIFKLWIRSPPTQNVGDTTLQSCEDSNATFDVIFEIRDKSDTTIVSTKVITARTSCASVYTAPGPGPVQPIE